LETGLATVGGFAALAATWRERVPAEVPFLCLGGAAPSRYGVLALRFSEISRDAAWATPLSARSVADGAAPPFRTGLVGLASYDDFCPASKGAGSPSRIFRVERALVVDRERRTVELTGDGAASARFVVPESAETALAAAWLGGGDRRAGSDAPPLDLVPSAPDADYLAKARAILADIAAGRFYQLNLLRYFTATRRGGDAPDDAWIARRLDRYAGPFAAWMRVPGEGAVELVSFSPERFVRLTPETSASGSRHLKLETWPVKGTAPRSEDRAQDDQAARDLATNAKDLAELAMIVDLMRNDVSRVAAPGTVAVEDPGTVVSFPTVHHLVARIASRLADAVTLGQLLTALCPGGSITGAPKLEVMAAIRALEGRERGYFMGNAFYLDDGGAFDSSILIRTLTRRAAADGGSAFEYAAGSGIVTRSDPEAELREIAGKCRVLTD
jgi:para-aminobenzoate synthetase component 1